MCAEKNDYDKKRAYKKLNVELLNKIFENIVEGMASHRSILVAFFL